MEKIKNIFDYATKELSQDAFLRWLFENYNCNNRKVRNVCYGLLNLLLNLELKDGEIVKLETEAQWNKIDVLVKILTVDKQNIVMAIEDKTFSGEHDQLKDYNEAIKNEYELNKDINYIIKKIFYKTALRNDEDEKACNKNKWQCFFIEDLYEQLYSKKEYDDTGSELLDSYISHIRGLYQDLTTISEKNMEGWSLINFRTYLDKKFVIPNQNKNENIIYEIWGWRNIYSSMAVYRKYNGNIRLSLELVTRHKSNNANIKICLRRIMKNGETEVSHEIKEIFKSYINENQYTEEDVALLDIIKKSKNEIARSNDKLNEMLSYSNNREQFENLINNILKWFENLLSKDLDSIIKEHNLKEYDEPINFKYMIIKIKEDYVNKKKK